VIETLAQGQVSGLIVTPEGVRDGSLHWAGGRISAVDGPLLSPAQADARAATTPWVLPGFVDLHCHGAGGRDVMEGADAAERIAQVHVRHGTTALLATTMTAPLPEIEAAFAPLAGQVAQRRPQSARWLGMHLEGPYINPERLGAQPDFPQVAQLDTILALHARAPIRVITLAPEQAGHLDLIPALVREGFRIQIGHSNGTYDDGVAALERGAHGFTHLFNAMSGLHHRTPGMVGAALAHAQHAELIPDLLHVHPGALRVALRAIPGCYCVTDATSATGMPDGEYRLGRHRVLKCMGGVRLADGTLAGSALTLDQALRNLVVHLGLSVEEGARRTATIAADYLGLPDRGRLAVGAHADIVVLNRDLQLQHVHAEGEEIDL
jgi:N-acetylglucosamine-6-phosphate deacetylase